MRHAAFKYNDVWSDVGLNVGDKSLGVGTFVDNIVLIGRCPFKVCGAIDKLDFVKASWGVRLSDDSKQYLLPKGSLLPHPGAPWQKCDQMKLLGHWLTSNASTLVCLSASLGAINRAVFANLKRHLRQASAHVRSQFLRANCLGLVRSRWARYPYCKTSAKRLDAAQRHNIKLLFPTIRKPGECDDAYFKRRSLEAGRRASAMGSWSGVWARDTIAWRDHILRGHDSGSWSNALFKWRPSSFLSTVRSIFSGRNESRLGLRRVL